MFVFSIVVSIEMAINKSGERSMKHVGVYLPKSMFFHGQVDVAISGLSNSVGLRILMRY